MRDRLRNETEEKREKRLEYARERHWNKQRQEKTALHRQVLSCKGTSTKRWKQARKKTLNAGQFLLQRIASSY